MLLTRTLLLLLSVFPLLAQAPYAPPDDVSYRRANIFSEGTRMSAEVFSPKATVGGQKLPSIVMAHGWGGTAALLRREAAAFAHAGYLVVTFDYRGWGDSDSRVILTAPAPSATQIKFNAEVQAVREVVDPIDFATDWFNAIHWIQAEPNFDPNRLGLWGSSFSGALVVYVAARDPRVKAIHSQVGPLDGRIAMMANDVERRKTYDEATRMARGELGYAPPGVRVIGNLRGAPVRARFLLFTPVDDVEKAPACAMQFVLAEKEELFDNRDHVLKAYPHVKGPKNLVIVPNITHYGIYTTARDQAQKLALDWFDKYLKGGKQENRVGGGR
jgi:pimeloyl-ACP methyl ester carboxylesterase